MDFSGFYFNNNPSDEFMPYDVNKTKHLSNQQFTSLQSIYGNTSKSKVYLNQPSFSYYTEKIKFFDENAIKNNEETRNIKIEEDGRSISSCSNTSEISIEDEIGSIESTSSEEVTFKGLKNIAYSNSRANSDPKDKPKIMKTVEQMRTETIPYKNDISLQTKTENKSFDIPFNYGVVSGLFIDKQDSTSLNTIFAVTLDEKRKNNAPAYNSNQMNNVASTLHIKRELNSNNNIEKLKNQSAKIDSNQTNKGKSAEVIITNTNINNNVIPQENIINQKASTNFQVKTMSSIYFSQKKTSSKQSVLNKNLANDISKPRISVLEFKDKTTIIDHLKSTVDEKFKINDLEKKQHTQSEIEKMIEMAAIMLDSAAFLGQVDELLSKIKHSLN
jgi:hypothetical protein